MSITSTSSRISYSGNGVTTVFSFPYPFLANADLVVISRAADGTETVKTLTTHYTVTGAGTGSGSVTMLSAPASGTSLIIYLDPAATQADDFVGGDSLPAETIETAFDKLTLITQRLKNLASRSVHLSEGYTASFDPTLPTVLTADTLLQINAAGTALECGPTATDVSNAEANALAAAASASAAASSQTAAASSATSAASSATSASSSATTATTQASAASTSATNAATSETNAASSASAASTSATAAASSATSASSSATTATTQASNASTSATSASTSETNAASSATAAASSASAAAASATAAATSETNAAASATSAADTLANAAIGVASAVDSEVALFSGTGGKQLKRATGSGRPKLTSGVLSVAAIDLTSEVTGTLPLGSGGTGQTTKGPAFDALSPMSAVGDLIYGGTSGTGTRLAPNTSTTQKFLAMTGTGSAGQAPSWQTVASGTLTAQTKSANYTVLTTDDIIFISGGSWTLTFPAAGSSTGKIYRVVRTDENTSGVTISPNLLGASRKMFTSGEVLEIEDNGTTYTVLNHFTDTPWTSWAMTVGGTTTAPTLATGSTKASYWRRQGANMEIHLEYYQTATTGSAAGSGTYLFPIYNNSGYTIDTTAVGGIQNGGGSDTVGAAAARSGAVGNTGGRVAIYDTTNLYLDIGQAGTGLTATVTDSYFGVASSAVIRYSFTAVVPITGWW